MPYLRAADEKSCPDAESLSAFADQRLGHEQREAMVSHLAACASCSEIGQRLERGFGAEASVTEPEWQNTAKRLDNWMRTVLAHRSVREEMSAAEPAFRRWWPFSWGLRPKVGFAFGTVVAVALMVGASLWLMQTAGPSPTAALVQAPRMSQPVAALPQSGTTKPHEMPEATAPASAVKEASRETPVSAEMVHGGAPRTSPDKKVPPNQSDIVTQETAPRMAWQKRRYLRKDQSDIVTQETAPAAVASNSPKAAVQPASPEAKLSTTERAAVEGTRHDREMVAVAPSTVPPPSTDPAMTTGLRKLPQQSESGVLRIPAGTQLSVRLLDAVNSGQNRPGDVLRAILDQAISVDGRVVAPRHTEVLGRIAAVRAGRASGVAQLWIVLYQMTIGGQAYTIHSDPIQLAAQSERGRDAAKIGITAGAGIGAAIGAITGGGRAAATGTAAGEEVLTNEGVIELAKAGLSDDLIIAKIRESKTNFKHTAADLVRLKKEGVSEKVIAVMLEVPESASPAPVSPPKEPGVAAGALAARSAQPAAGSGVVLATKGRELILGPETVLVFRLAQELSVKAPE